MSMGKNKAAPSAPMTKVVRSSDQETYPQADTRDLERGVPGLLIKPPSPVTAQQPSKADAVPAGAKRVTKRQVLIGLAAVITIVGISTAVAVTRRHDQRSYDEREEISRDALEAGAARVANGGVENVPTAEDFTQELSELQVPVVIDPLLVSAVDPSESVQADEEPADQTERPATNEAEEAPQARNDLVDQDVENEAPEQPGEASAAVSEPNEAESDSQTDATVLSTARSFANEQFDQLEEQTQGSKANNDILSQLLSNPEALNMIKGLLSQDSTAPAQYQAALSALGLGAGRDAKDDTAEDSQNDAASEAKQEEDAPAVEVEDAQGAEVAADNEAEDADSA